MRRTRLVFAPQAPQQPVTYLLLNEFGEPVGRGEQPLSPPAPVVPETVVLVVPGVDAAARWLNLPTRNDAQARTAAALLLEDSQALDDEALHLAVGPLEADGHRLVVAVARAQMQAWIELARLYGLTPEAVTPDHLLLPAPEDGRPIAARLGEMLAVRGPRLALSCEPDLAPVLIDDPDLQVLEHPDEVDARLAQGAGQPLFNLLQGDFAPSDGRQVARRELLRPALLAAALLLSPILLDAANAARLTFAARETEAAAESRAAQVLPKGTVVSDAAAQTTAHLQRLEIAAGDGPAGLAARLFHALSGLEGAQAEGVIVSPDGAMRATISHVNYSDMDLLADALGRQGVAFKQEGVREEGGRIVSEVILGVRS
jgi:general secretion pathway protein L